MPKVRKTHSSYVKTNFEHEQDIKVKRKGKIRKYHVTVQVFTNKIVRRVTAYVSSTRKGVVNNIWTVTCGPEDLHNIEETAKSVFGFVCQCMIEGKKMLRISDDIRAQKLVPLDRKEKELDDVIYAVLKLDDQEYNALIIDHDGKKHRVDTDYFELV